jgi:AT-hook transcription factor
MANEELTLRQARIEARKLGIPNVRQIADLDELLDLIEEAKSNGSGSKRSATRAVKGTAVKRGPGRPKGSRNKPKDEPVVVKRGPGRPRKVVVEEVEETPKRRPGRPRKNQTVAAEPVKRGPGRPKGSTNKTTAKATNTRANRGANGGQIGRPAGTGTGTRAAIADELDWSTDIDFRPGTIAAEIMDEIYNQVDNKGLTNTTEIRHATTDRLAKRLGKEPFVFRYGRNGDEMDDADAYKMLVYRVNRAIFDYAMKTGQHKSATQGTRGRGRPAKAETVETPKRGRGRPAKATQETPKPRGRPKGSTNRPKAETPQKRRGRPPGSKNKPKVEETTVRRGPGRPRKTETTTATTTRRRGRPRTRA